jgi:hypothetical protein
VKLLTRNNDDLASPNGDKGVVVEIGALAFKHVENMEIPLVGMGLVLLAWF